MNEYSPSPKTLVITYILLLLLLAATVAASQWELGGGSLLVTVVIAATKAALVAIVFMQLRGETTVTRIVATSGILWLALLIGLTFTDVLTRGWV